MFISLDWFGLNPSSNQSNVIGWEEIHPNQPIKLSQYNLIQTSHNPNQAYGTHTALPQSFIAPEDIRWERLMQHKTNEMSHAF